MRLRAIVLLCAPLCAAQVQLQLATAVNTQSRGPFSYSSAVALQNGDALLIGSSPVTPFLSTTPHSQVTFATVGPAAFQMITTGVPPVIGGSGDDSPTAAAVDPSGNIWIVGSTNSDDFNLVNPIISTKVPYRTAGFVLELDPTGTQLLFATYLAGQQPPNPTCPSCPLYTSATSIAIDSAGNVYVGGSTNEADFPTTPGAYMTAQNATAGGGLVVPISDAFAVKISPTGKLAYSTSLGSGPLYCYAPIVDPSECIGHEEASAGVVSLAANAAGVLTVVMSELGSPESINVLSGDASTFTPLAPFSTPGPIGQTVVAEDSSGNLNLFGIYGTTSQTLGLYAAKIAPSGGVIYSTDLGGASDVSVAGIVLDEAGNAYLAGTSSSAQFPSLTGVPNVGPGFLLRLSAAGTAAQTLLRFPAGVVSLAPALTVSGDVVLANSTGWVLTIDPAYDFTTPAIVEVVNSASILPVAGLAPGELVTLFGFDLGVSPVQIGGMAATVLYSGPNQINVQVPFDIQGAQIQAEGNTVGGLFPTQVNGAWLGPSLGLFTTDGVHAAALNQDGSVNSAANPAAQGSVISLFGTGAIWPAGIADGAVAPAAMALNQEQNQFEAVDGSGTPLSILYEGAAPGLIYGVFQLNVQLTGDVNPRLTLLAPSGLSADGQQSSNPVVIYVK